MLQLLAFLISLTLFNSFYYIPPQQVTNFNKSTESFVLLNETVKQNNHKVPSTKESTKKPRVAYTTLSYGDDTCAALTAALNVREVLNQDPYASSTRYHTDVIIMRIGDPIPDSNLPDGVIQRMVKPTKALGMHQW